MTVDFFAPLKQACGHLVENKARHNFNMLTNLTFLRPMPKLVQRPLGWEISKIALLQAAWSHQSRKGAWEAQYTTQDPYSRSTDSAPKTPHDLKQLENQASTIKNLLKQRTRKSSKPHKQCNNRLIKGFEIHMNSAIILSKEVQDLWAAHEKMLQRKRQSK